MKASQQPIQSLGTNTLARHAGINFQMHCERHRRQGACRSRFLQDVEMPRLPNHGSQPLIDDRLGFAAKDSRHQENARLWADRADGGAFLARGHPQPLGSRSSQQRCTRPHVVAIRVGLYHRHQLSSRTRDRRSFL